MLETFRRLLIVLTPRQRRHCGYVFALILIGGAIEMMGVASIMPFMTVLSDPEAVVQNEQMRALYELTGFTSADSFVIFLGVCFVLIFTLSICVRAVSEWAQLRFTKMRVHSIGSELKKKYLGQPYSWFLRQHSSRLATIILGEVNQAISKSLFPAMQLVASVILAVMLTAILLVLAPTVAVSAMLFLAVSYGVIYLIVRRPLLELGRKRYLSNVERYRVTQETFAGIKDVKVLCLEKNMLQRFMKPSYDTAHHEVRATILGRLPAYLMQIVGFSGIVLVLLYLIATLGSMEAALPTFSVFALAGYRLMPTLQQIYRNAASLRENTAALDNLIRDYRTLDALPQVQLDDQPRLDPPTQAIELRDVSFRYPEAQVRALEDIDIRIPIFNRVGLVGATGSGKTTLVDIILGLLEPESGSVIVDSLEIDSSNVRRWRRCIGYVPQQIFLADDTVAANIAFGLAHKQIDLDAVERAARIANLHEFVTTQLPDGYQTKVGERGVRLSGGQRQRIGIARALYCDPDVLVMDEATSALDNATEKAVMGAVENLGGKKTVVLIAHRLSTVMSCDRIYMLEGGRVAASGTYSELIDKSEDFRYMAGLESA